MKSVAALRLTCSDVKASSALSAVLAPDNEGAPRGIKLSMTDKGATIFFRLETDAGSAAVSTAMAILRDASLFQEVWLLSHGSARQAERDS